jgi:hypothetical protein
MNSDKSISLQMGTPICASMANLCEHYSVVPISSSEARMAEVARLGIVRGDVCLLEEETEITALRKQHRSPW